MGYMPRLRVRHTSESEAGQVYIPGINWTLMIACIGLVLGFQTSSNLAAAYGVAVTTTMVITTMLFYVVARERFGWSRGPTLALCAGFMIVDLAFFAGNIFKIPDGGWFPLVVGAAVYTLITTWRRGRNLVGNRTRRGLVPVQAFLDRLDDKTPRVPGTAYHLTADPDQIPSSLLVNLRHNNALHEQVVLLHVHLSGLAHVPNSQRARIEKLSKGFSRVVLRYGFRDEVDVPRALRDKVFHHRGFDDDDITYVVGLDDVHATDRAGMPVWRERLFAVMNRNATGVTNLYKLPHDRVIEIGRPVDI
jgi:KUP system potassium uptake protein